VGPFFLKREKRDHTHYSSSEPLKSSNNPDIPDADGGGGGGSAGES
jgi:hypothetical protein